MGTRVIINCIAPALPNRERIIKVRFLKHLGMVRSYYSKTCHKHGLIDRKP